MEGTSFLKKLILLMTIVIGMVIDRWYTTLLFTAVYLILFSFWFEEKKWK